MFYNIVLKCVIFFLALSLYVINSILLNDSPELLEIIEEIFIRKFFFFHIMWGFVPRRKFLLYLLSIIKFFVQNTDESLYIHCRFILVFLSFIFVLSCSWEHYIEKSSSKIKVQKDLRFLNNLSFSGEILFLVTFTWCSWSIKGVWPSIELEVTLYYAPHPFSFLSLISILFTLRWFYLMFMSININRTKTCVTLTLVLASMYLSFQAFVDTSQSLHINIADLNILQCFIGLRLVLRLISIFLYSLKVLKKLFNKSHSMAFKFMSCYGLLLDIVWVFLLVIIPWWGEIVI